MPHTKLRLGKRAIKQEDRIEISIRNAQILGEFLNLGFKTFDAFCSIVSHFLKDYKSENGRIVLRQFWDIRIRTMAINDDVESVLEKLKEE